MTLFSRVGNPTQPSFSCLDSRHSNHKHPLNATTSVAPLLHQLTRRTSPRMRAAVTLFTSQVRPGPTTIPPSSYLRPTTRSPPYRQPQNHVARALANVPFTAGLHLWYDRTAAARSRLYPLTNTPCRPPVEGLYQLKGLASHRNRRLPNCIPKMFSNFVKPSMMRPVGAFGQLSKAGSNARFMATVHNNNAAPKAARRAGITRDRATFTIKVRRREKRSQGSMSQSSPPAHRTAPSTPENPSVLRRISPARPSSPPLSSATPSPCPIPPTVARSLFSPSL